MKKNIKEINLKKKMTSNYRIYHESVIKYIYKGGGNK